LRIGLETTTEFGIVNSSFWTFTTLVASVFISVTTPWTPLMSTKSPFASERE